MLITDLGEALYDMTDLKVRGFSAGSPIADSFSGDGLHLNVECAFIFDLEQCLSRLGDRAYLYPHANSFDIVI